MDFAIIYRNWFIWAKRGYIMALPTDKAFGIKIKIDSKKVLTQIKELKSEIDRLEKIREIFKQGKA